MSSEGAYLLAQAAPLCQLLCPERQPEDGAWKGVPHVTAKDLEGSALVGVVVQQVCLGEVCPHAWVDGRDREICAVWVKVHHGRPRHEGGDIRQVIARVETNPAGQWKVE